MQDSQPLVSTLSGLACEYRILQLYARDAGLREAKLMFDVGQGTQDLGFRNEIDVLFDVQLAHEVTLHVTDENGAPTTGKSSHPPVGCSPSAVTAYLPSHQAHSRSVTPSAASTRPSPSAPPRISRSTRKSTVPTAATSACRKVTLQTPPAAAACGGQTVADSIWWLFGGCWWWWPNDHV